jgi:hypothetical protein
MFDHRRTFKKHLYISVTLLLLPEYCGFMHKMEMPETQGAAALAQMAEPLGFSVLSTKSWHMAIQNKRLGT